MQKKSLPGIDEGTCMPVALYLFVMGKWLSVVPCLLCLIVCLTEKEKKDQE